MRQRELVQIGDETRTAIEWARRYGVPWYCVKNRIARNQWPAERALTTPPLSRSAAGRNGKLASHWNGQPICRGSRGRNPQ